MLTKDKIKALFQVAKALKADIEDVKNRVAFIEEQLEIENVDEDGNGDSSTGTAVQGQSANEGGEVLQNENSAENGPVTLIEEDFAELALRKSVKAASSNEIK
uniref:Uncharacterized protein n=1 Tax=Moniliophthora roreri TaxID=221103 RepID=A0A0W0FUX4_MONRR